METDLKGVKGILEGSKESINKIPVAELKAWTPNGAIGKAVRKDPDTAKKQIKAINASPKIANFLKVRNLITDKDYGMLENVLKEINHKTV